MHEQVSAQAMSIALLEFAKTSIRSQSDHMAACFAELATRVDILCRQLETERERAGTAQHAVAVLQSREISELTRALIIDIQAHDITDQRLTHVTRLLQEDGSLADAALRDKLETILTERGERDVADRLLGGSDTAGITDAARLNNDIELF